MCACRHCTPQAHDPAAAAARLATACEEAQRLRAEEDTSGFTKLLAALKPKGAQPRKPPSGAASTGHAATSCGSSGDTSVSTSDGSGGSSMGGPPAAPGGQGEGGAASSIMGREELGTALQRRLGFRLVVRPSSIPHPEAGGSSWWVSGVGTGWGGALRGCGVDAGRGRAGGWGKQGRARGWGQGDCPVPAEAQTGQGDRKGEGSEGAGAESASARVSQCGT